MNGKRLLNPSRPRRASGLVVMRRERFLLPFGKYSSEVPDISRRATFLLHLDPFGILSLRVLKWLRDGGQAGWGCCFIG
jgi:hypothetical protein